MRTYVRIQEICRFNRGPEVQRFQMPGMGPCSEIAESSSPLRVLLQYFTFYLFVCLFYK